MTTIKLHLRPTREKSLQRRHPWVFSGAVQKIDGTGEPGSTCQIISSSGQWLASGSLSPKSQIIARVWSFNQEEEIGEEFFFNRLEKSIALRKSLFGPTLPDACRLVNAENDGLPGLIIDKYAGFLVCQFLSAGSDFWKKTIARQIEKLVPCEGVYERSDVEVRLKEGLSSVTGVMLGTDPPPLIQITENDLLFLVDVHNGHKTGFYLDQRENRSVVRKLAESKEVLNCFSYTGSFTIAALSGGAQRITSLDSSSPALDIEKQHIQLNGMDNGKLEQISGDVFTILRKFRDSRRFFDLIILDPPKFAESHSQMEKASRGYKDINLLSFKLLRPGGTLISFSCSGLVGRDLFEKIVADAALDAGKEARVIQWLSQPPDHPVALNFPEGMYLKGIVCKI